MPATFDAWADYLQRTCADAVFILGDLFELWVGDDARCLPFETQCVEVLAQTSARRPLSFMVGNRDFLLGRDMLAACGMSGLPDPTVLRAFGKRALLTHGDILCLDDRPYQAFRKLVHSADWRSRTLALTLTERQKMAADIRSQSESRRQFDGAINADIDPVAALAWLLEADAPCLIHGHTHRPGSEPLAPGRQRHVLSDWDLDSSHRAEVLRWTQGGYLRIAPDRAHLPEG